MPGIALLAFMLPVLGIGAVPAVTALFLYSLYPIVRGAVTGLGEADRGAVEAAHALGMTAAQIRRYVRVPLAVPVIMAGIRTAAVINVGTATLAAFVGAGGLGDPIVAGLALADSRMVLSGAIPAALLALAVDAAPRRGRTLAHAGRAPRPRRGVGRLTANTVQCQALNSVQCLAPVGMIRAARHIIGTRSRGGTGRCVDGRQRRR